MIQKKILSSAIQKWPGEIALFKAIAEGPKTVLDALSHLSALQMEKIAPMMPKLQEAALGRIALESAKANSSLRLLILRNKKDNLEAIQAIELGQHLRTLYTQLQIKLFKAREEVLDREDHKKREMLDAHLEALKMVGDTARQAILEELESLKQDRLLHEQTLGTMRQNYEADEQATKSRYQPQIDALEKEIKEINRQ